MSTHYVESEDSRIAGWYATDTDTEPDVWTWRDSGNGPEVTHDQVWGPYATEQQARDFLRGMIDDLADDHADAAYEDEGEAAFGRPD